MLTPITITGSSKRTLARRSRSFQPERFCTERIARKRRCIDAEKTQRRRERGKEGRREGESKPIDRRNGRNDTTNCRRLIYAFAIH